MSTKLTPSGNPIDVRPAPAAAARWPTACSKAACMRWVYLLIGLAGCQTPSVPLPPPDLQALTFTATTPGFVQVIGQPQMRHADARFYVFDYGSGEGVITQAAHDGSFASMPFAGADGDTVQIYFDTSTGDRSQEACTTLQRDVGLISTRCP
jgi:hypothetical protein